MQVAAQWSMWMRGTCEQGRLHQNGLAVFKQARSLGVAVFFISGRHEGATRRNDKKSFVPWVLRAIGDFIWRPMAPVTAADFKTPQRERIEKDGYTIIANVGDQPSDPQMVTRR